MNKRYVGIEELTDVNGDLTEYGYIIKRAISNATEDTKDEPVQNYSTILFRSMNKYMDDLVVSNGLFKEGVLRLQEERDARAAASAEED